MAKKLDSKELVSFKELLMSEVTQSEALVNLLERKEIYLYKSQIGDYCNFDLRIAIIGAQMT